MHDTACLARLALCCLDLTSLNDHDDADSIVQLAARAAAAPAPVAAWCVWPRLVAQARALAPAGVAVAAVANFPQGEVDLAAAVAQTQAIVDAGAQEVDLVLPWRALRDGDARSAATLVRAVRAACPALQLKLIVESGQLVATGLLAQACRIGLDEGVDFLKTSTGKTQPGATPEAARVMLEAIAAHPRAASVGFKASGGIRSVADAAPYIDLTRTILGPDALTPRRFRLGASALLDDITRVLVPAGGAQGDHRLAGTADAAAAGSGSGPVAGSAGGSGAGSGSAY